MRRYVMKRLAWSVLAAWIVVTAVFLVIALTPNPNEALVAWGAGEDTEVVERWREARNYHLPLHERYRLWLVAFLTFDWGTTFDGRPVADAFATTIPVTLLYVIPAMVVSTAIGVAVGLYAAVREGGVLDRLGTPVVYAGIGLPVFWVSQLLVLGVARHEIGVVAIGWNGAFGPTHPENLRSIVLPALVVTVNMAAIQARFTRSESLEFLPEDFVRRMRASGARTRDVARHVLRNASLLLVSLFFIEGLGVLLVTVYVVEAVFNLPGVGSLAHTAIVNRDPNVVLPATMLVALVGIAGNIVQDVLYAILDPRVEVD